MPMKTYLRNLTAMLTLCLVCSTAWAEIPANYYKSLIGKKDAELKTAASDLIKNFTSVRSYNSLPDYFKVTDVRPVITPQVWWDMYSDMMVETRIQFGTYMNREHSFPKSWWGGDTDVKAYTDLNHLYPGEAKANQAKSNYPLGEVRTASKFYNGVSMVGSPKDGLGGGSALVFEPDDEYKGDFARTYFYMVTCYQDYTWARNNMYMLQQNTYPTLSGWAVDMLLKWHREDPVSDKEQNRNDNVYMIQGNRNPFIDYPELAEYIWGTKRGLAFNPSDTPEPVDEAVLYAPVKDSTLDFGQVAEGNTVKASLFFRGENFRKAINISLYSGDTGMFELPSSSIAASLVNATDGYWLNITYKPTSLGTHEARLMIICDDLNKPVGVNLRGECLPQPTLTACTALNPTNITSDSYEANWESPDGEVIDYWIITRTKFKSGSQTTEEILAESSPFEITGFSENDSESYAVQSVRLGVRSPMSNVIFVAHSGISGVDCDEPLTVTGFDGMMRFNCAQTQTGVMVYDITGRLVRIIDSVDNDTDVEMPLGVYFIVTDQHHSPVKVAIR